MTKLTISPTEGDSVSLRGMGVIFKVFGAQTGGAFSIVEHPLDPGLLTPPHVHMHEDELTYLVSGAQPEQVLKRIITTLQKEAQNGEEHEEI
jgi:uncharacterized cupin superfamily protein